MRDESLFYWGMVVTIFLLIAAMLTARELLEMYLSGEDDDPGEDNDTGSSALSGS